MIQELILTVWSYMLSALVYSLGQKTAVCIW